MKPITIPCCRCGGSGRIELTGVYRDTLTLLQKHQPASGAQLARLEGCEATAMNNRLAALERHGLATSEWYGRKRLYRTGN